MDISHRMPGLVPKIQSDSIPCGPYGPYGPYALHVLWKCKAMGMCSPEHSGHYWHGQGTRSWKAGLFGESESAPNFPFPLQDTQAWILEFNPKVKASP